jgi:2-(1,2-epoxy-1,2-dihydrophenyl)acetyl-CoA isomerase
MSDALVLTATDGAVRTLTLNRPQALNSFTVAMHEQLRAALDAAANDTAVRCVIVTGAGRAFCAGQDLAEVAAHAGEDIDTGEMIERLYRPLALRVRSMPVPMIAAVNGAAAGAGANFALGCDLVIAARSASFMQAFSRIGLIPDCGGTWLLPRLVGRARALALAITAEKLPAEEAQRIGLIWQCVEDAELMNSARALAARLAAMPTRALVETRRGIDAAMNLNLEAALKLEGDLQRELARAHDYREGVAAFLAKRPPEFSDR